MFKTLIFGRKFALYNFKKIGFPILLKVNTCYSIEYQNKITKYVGLKKADKISILPLIPGDAFNSIIQVM